MGRPLWNHRGQTDAFEKALEARIRRLRAELAATTPFGYPTSGDPNVIGEHEVPPLRCQCCNAIIPWALIKGWRN